MNTLFQRLVKAFLLGVEILFQYLGNLGIESVERGVFAAVGCVVA